MRRAAATAMMGVDWVIVLSYLIRIYVVSLNLLYEMNIEIYAYSVVHATVPHEMAV